jgi:NAD(P)-dependent dehydrogenase (short-subunit alcohol dehydrogenase family)
MAAKLDGRVTLITGGGSGIGRATALACAEEGNKAIIADSDGEGRTLKTCDPGRRVLDIDREIGLND